MPDPDGNPVRALGRLLTTGGVGILKDAEIPREGVNVRRQPAITCAALMAIISAGPRAALSVGRGEG